MRACRRSACVAGDAAAGLLHACRARASRPPTSRARGRDSASPVSIFLSDSFREMHEPRMRYAAPNALAEGGGVREVADVRHPGLDVGAPEVRALDLANE